MSTDGHGVTREFEFFQTEFGFSISDTPGVDDITLK